ncbi:hypothetical protein GGR40_004280 [Novosphingobium gossypii]
MRLFVQAGHDYEHIRVTHGNTPRSHRL